MIEKTAGALAMIDTGAQYTVIGGEIAELACAHGEDLDLDVSMSTRLGTIRGRMYRLAIELVAEEGEDLSVSATVLVAPDWSGPVVLGYRGFLERVRLGFDPGLRDGNTSMCFGLAG